MTEAQIALARRAVAAPGWRWLPGMRIANTKFARVVEVCDGEPCGAEEGATEDDNAAVWLEEWATTPLLPDLSDDLTALGLLALVRERWGMPHLTLTRKSRWWTYRGDSRASLELYEICAATEVEALVAALEVAP
jgi:hypothetical protein